MYRHVASILSLVILAHSAVIQNHCDVSFQKDVFTHSKNKQRPLRIKMSQNDISLPCSLTVRLPSNQTAAFTIAGDEIRVDSIPAILQNKINVLRKSSDNLWLEVLSLDEETRSGFYEISGRGGHTVFGIQTPSNGNILATSVENLSCSQQQHRGTVAITPQFSLCHRYNLFKGNSHHLRHVNIQSFTVGEDKLHFVARANASRFRAAEVFCEITEGDGIKVYKIKFNIDPAVCSQGRNGAVLES